MSQAQAETQTRCFEIQEFARLAGVTVRALQHYDRMGILTPLRSQAGSRLYSEADLQALVQILALKSVGVPLKQIGMLQADGPSALLETLGSQRRALERRQPLVDRVIFAVRDVEAALGRGEQADPAVLRPFVDALRQEPEEALSDHTPPPSTAPKWEDLRAEWQTLLADTESAGHDDPASPAAQALAARWERLMGVCSGGGSCREALKAHADSLRMVSRPSVAGSKPFSTIGQALAHRAG